MELHFPELAQASREGDLNFIERRVLSKPIQREEYSQVFYSALFPSFKENNDKVLRWWMENFSRIQVLSHGDSISPKFWNQSFTVGSRKIALPSTTISNLLLQDDPPFTVLDLWAESEGIVERNTQLLKRVVKKGSLQSLEFILKSPISVFAAVKCFRWAAKSFQIDKLSQLKDIFSDLTFTQEELSQIIGSCTRAKHSSFDTNGHHQAMKMKTLDWLIHNFTFSCLPIYTTWVKDYFHWLSMDELNFWYDSGLLSRTFPFQIIFYELNNLSAQKVKWCRKVNCQILWDNNISPLNHSVDIRMLNWHFENETLPEPSHELFENICIHDCFAQFKWYVEHSTYALGKKGVNIEEMFSTKIFDHCFNTDWYRILKYWKTQPFQIPIPKIGQGIHNALQNSKFQVLEWSLKNFGFLPLEDNIKRNSFQGLSDKDKQQMKEWWKKFDLHYLNLFRKVHSFNIFPDEIVDKFCFFHGNLSGFDYRKIK
nr:hypothetical protein pmam_467 [Pithovirus mammoth]